MSRPPPRETSFDTTGVTAALGARLAERYAIDGALGRGGMAVVYRARDLRHRRLVALKVLNPNVAAALGPQRFLREIETAANLSHPHILPLFDSGEVDGTLYYVMPYVAGGTLRDRLTREGRLPVATSLSILRQTADALDHAHAQGVVHRDVKPENILLTPGGDVLVADFGIAHRPRPAPAPPPDEGPTPSGDTMLTTTAGMVIGTPAYMSPEQSIPHGEISGASDQYALACVAFEMLSGVAAFSGTSHDIAIRRYTGSPPSLVALRPDLPMAVDGALARTFALTPGERFPSAMGFHDALAHALQAGGLPPAGIPGRPQWRTWGFRAALVGVVGYPARTRSLARSRTLFAQRPPRSSHRSRARPCPTVRRTSCISRGGRPGTSGTAQGCCER